MPPKKLLLVNPQNRAALYRDFLWQPLALAYVAAAAPGNWQVELCDEACEGPICYDEVDADLVGLTAFTSQAPRAYEIAATFRARGIPVIMGGIHASMLPSEAARYVDAVFIGECEHVLPQVFADLEAGGLRAAYGGAPPQPMQGGLRPDRSIFAKYHYEYASAQTSRGCPMDCSFCSVTAFNGGVFRMRPVAEVIDELRTIAERHVLFVDDDLNGFSREARRRCAALCRAITEADLGKTWITQVTVNFGDDDELPRLAREAGCAGVFVGFESTDTASLARVGKDGRSRRRGTDYYRENIARIRSHGIAVLGSFILGIDTQDQTRIVADILEFAEQTGLDALNPTILTPLPGTRDYARLDAEGRILFKDYPADWEKYTFAFPVMDVPGVSGARLMRHYVDLLQFFHPDRVRDRHWRTHDTVSADAAWHAYLWNRGWTNYCIRTGWLRDWPRSGSELPREPPARPPA